MAEPESLEPDPEPEPEIIDAVALALPFVLGNRTPDVMMEWLSTPRAPRPPLRFLRRTFARGFSSRGKMGP